MDKMTDIKIFWDKQALEHGNSSFATMPDQYLKNLEIENILKYLKPGMKVADIGCGNGFSSFEYAKALDISIHGLDYSDAMIEQAQIAHSNVPLDMKNKISFNVGDVRETGFEASCFEAVITDRCLINLTSREDQAKAIKEMHRILKKDGFYLMCEDTEQGLANLNGMRKVVGLPEIEVRWHNLYLDESLIQDAIKDLFELISVDRFSSFYYLASRVINGKIANEKSEMPRYDSDINRVAAMCSSLGDFGDFGPLKLFVLKKI